MTVILLLRHGRTEANARRLLVGRIDPALDAEGRRQAEASAKAVAATTEIAAGPAGAPGEGVPPLVVSSPLQRCRATAEVVAGELGTEVVVDERWIELDYGELDGVPLASVPSETWAKWQADIGWTPPGGESIAELGERVRAACADLQPYTVVVTHVSPIKAAVAWALGVGDEVAWRMFVAPASITQVDVRADGHRSLHTFNETSHLSPFVL